MDSCSSVITPEDVLESLMNDGTIDALRLKIINQLKANVNWKKKKKKKSLPSHFSSGYSLFFYFFKFFGWFKFWVFKKKLFFIICNLRANGAMKALGLMGFMFDLSTNLIYITLNDIKGKVHVYKHTCTWWSCLLHTSFDNRTLPIFSAETLLFVTKSSIVYKSVFVFFISEVLYIQLMYVFM